MKFIGKILSACALLVAVVNCYGVETQDIYIKNKTQGPIWGGVYATTAGGKVLDLAGDLAQKMSKEMAKDDCRVITITKPKDQKRKQFHRLIFAKDSPDSTGQTAEEAVKSKVNSDNGKNVSSTMIKQLSGGKDLYYEVHDDKNLITRAPQLKFKKVSLFGCANKDEPTGKDVIESLPYW